ncbi:hypothetical protein C7999DRAFT_14853 [Corynascus novoguineensis]|uniref:Fungal N-terminal domain-containing protein n=1 Tax=Corynascus novoguineensis TaxID=1126955 RepID=A0AAN7HEY1_9PEZI|nr:hypothetical protein C7999DRAFT_14853 [Corynascus novoguineensis]
MAKIAWRIANALTKGQKSAPAEFREVENQLCALSTSLSALKDVCGADLAAIVIDPTKLPARFQKEEQVGVHSVAGILDSCGETLKHLEKIVDSYTVVAASSDPTRPRLQRWSTELIKNYKKIAWTTESGDLATLRSQLMVYTNSLQLVLGTIVSSRTTRIEDSLKENSAMLREIHSWWAHNLKGAVKGEGNPVAQTPPDGLQASRDLASFELYLTSNGTPQSLCPEACLCDDWREVGNTQLFECRCKQNTSHPNHTRVENISLSPFSFPFRQPGDVATWTLFKALDRSTNQMVSVTIANVAASDVAKFEQSFVQPLAEGQAYTLLRQGISNQLAHPSPDASSVRALKLQSDLKGYHKLIDSVTFRVGHRSLSKTYVEGLSLLNYCEPGHQPVRFSDNALDYAELSIYYGDDGTDEFADITKSVVYCARELQGKLEEMRIELFIANLQSPRAEETVVLQLQATEVQCEVAVIPDAELLITRNHKGQYRLIITSRNECTILTQVLSDAFFASSPSEPSFTAPTWLVRLEESGKRKVYRYLDGFRFLRFCSTSAEKMFELGRSAVLQGGVGERTLPIR